MWKENIQLFRTILIIFLLLSSVISLNSNAYSSKNTHQYNSVNITTTNQQHPWPMFRHDPQHTGYTSYTGPPQPEIKWKFIADKGIVSSAAIAYDGTIYFGSGWESGDIEGGSIYALNSDGTLKWRYKSERGFFSSPAIGPDNIIYISSLDGSLYALKDEGKKASLLWEKPLEFFFNLCSPLIDPNGLIHIGSPSFNYYQINPDGTTHWNYKTEWCIISSPAMDTNGVIYIGSKDHNLYAFNTNPPSLKWKFPTGAFYDGHLVDSSPAIGNDGTIYVGTDPYGAYGQDPVMVRDNIWAIHPDGTLKWVFETDDGVESSPAIGPEGTIYVGSYDGCLYAIKDNTTYGQLKWKYQTADAIDGSPIVDGDGIIYVGSRDGNLYSFYPNGTIRWIFETIEGFESSPTLDGNGYLYIGGFDNTFYCIGTGKSDIGVRSITIPSHVAPTYTIIPQATIENHRKDEQECRVTCQITQDDFLLYNDEQIISLADAKQKQLSFSPWIINSDDDKILNVSITIHHPRDENTYNNNLATTIISSLNNKPEPPSITGINTIQINQPYTFQFNTQDPENNHVSYLIDWGDTNTIYESEFNPSNQTYTINHTWSTEGSYTLRAKAKDIWGEESNWTYHEISVQKSRIYYLITTLLEQVFPLIKQLPQSRLSNDISNNNLIDILYC